MRLCKMFSVETELIEKIKDEFVQDDFHKSGTKLSIPYLCCLFGATPFIVEKNAFFLSVLLSKEN